jgi:flagellar export protein FliJ
MKRFHFPLDRVRRWRQEQAALEELKLQRWYAQSAALDEEKARVENERAASERKVLGQAAVEAGELQALNAYRLHVRARIGGIERRRGEVLAEIEKQRQRLIEARRRAELLERLKARMFDAWRLAADREDETLAGELYLAKWRPRRRI